MCNNLDFADVSKVSVGYRFVYFIYSVSFLYLTIHRIDLLYLTFF